MLNNKAKILQLDSKNMLGSIQLLGGQIEEVLALAKKVKIPISYKKVNNIVVLGMGGSALGAHLIKSVFFKDLKMSVEVVNGYRVPEFVSEKTLVIASSYSGSTEEVLNAASDAKKKKAKIMVIASGGTLADWAKKNKIPALVFSTKNNPCGSPRMGLGYLVFGELALLEQIELLKLNNGQINKCISTIKYFQERFGVDAPAINNRAKQIAEKTFNRSVWFIASEHLAGNAHVAANQINENGKRFAGYFLLPEMNHHLLEGMIYPKSNIETLLFILIKSDLYDSRVKARYEITKKILDKNNILDITYLCQSETEIEQACEVLVLSSYVSFYSAMLQGIDPTAIPVVDFFKAQLKK